MLLLDILTLTDRCDLFIKKSDSENQFALFSCQKNDILDENLRWKNYRLPRMGLKLGGLNVRTLKRVTMSWKRKMDGQKGRIF